MACRDSGCASIRAIGESNTCRLGLFPTASVWALGVQSSSSTACRWQSGASLRFSAIWAALMSSGTSYGYESTDTDASIQAQLGCSPEHQFTCFNGTKVQILTHVFELSLAVLRSTNGKVTGFNVVMKVFVNNVCVCVRPSAYEALSYYCMPPNDGAGVRCGDGR